MSLTSDIRQRLAAEHPVITRQVNDDVITLTDAEREAMLDEWAQRTVDGALRNLRAERDGLLAASDWTGLTDAPLTDAKRKAWAKYRQALRDLPETVADPTNVEWPLAPGEKRAKAPDAPAESVVE